MAKNLLLLCSCRGTPLWSLRLGLKRGVNVHRFLQPPRKTTFAGDTTRRNLAAKQCAEVRAELAAAVARLSSRAAVVSEARGIARKASTCNSTLLMRLVDLELRGWHALRKGEQVIREEFHAKPG